MGFHNPSVPWSEMERLLSLDGHSDKRRPGDVPANADGGDSQAPEASATATMAARRRLQGSGLGDEPVDGLIQARGPGRFGVPVAAGIELFERGEVHEGVPS